MITSQPVRERSRECSLPASGVVHRSHPHDVRDVRDVNDRPYAKPSLRLSSPPYYFLPPQRARISLTRGNQLYYSEDRGLGPVCGLNRAVISENASNVAQSVGYTRAGSNIFCVDAYYTNLLVRVQLLVLPSPAIGFASCRIGPYSGDPYGTIIVANTSFVTCGASPHATATDSRIVAYGEYRRNTRISPTHNFG